MLTVTRNTRTLERLHLLLLCSFHSYRISWFLDSFFLTNNNALLAYLTSLVLAHDLFIVFVLVDELRTGLSLLLYPMDLLLAGELCTFCYTLQEKGDWLADFSVSS